MLTVTEVAEYLKMNPQTIRNWIDRGELPAVRLGERRGRSKRSDLERLIEDGYTGRPKRDSSTGASKSPPQSLARGRL